MKNEFKLLLSRELALLNEASKHLQFSLNRCSNLKLNENGSEEELEKYEAFASRFARVNDIFIQKILRLIDKIELEQEGTLIDRINRAEKRGVIDNAEKFKEMRVLRNEIAHEYLQQKIIILYEKIIHFSVDLIEAVNSVNKYCAKYLE